MPLGLDLAADGGSGLRVASVASGGAAEAWNKQCRSDARQIWPGDRLLSINAVDTGDGMREEARRELLLRLALRRVPREAGHASTHASVVSHACSWHSMPEMMPYVAPWPSHMQAGGPALESEPKRKSAICRFEWADASDDGEEQCANHVFY